jgi:cell division cycle 2-like protein
MWSVGCIFAELMTKEPLFPGKNETDQIYKIFRLLGQPSSESWTDFHLLPGSKNIISPSSNSTTPLPPFSTLRQRFKYSTQNCLDLLSRLLSCDPSKRISADEALQHEYFKESPAPAHPSTFGSFPSVAAVSALPYIFHCLSFLTSSLDSAQGERKRDSPDAPTRMADKKLAYQLEMEL